MKLKNLIVNDKFRLIVSAIVLILSFFQIKILMFDLAWIAVILCGFPIIVNALKGLITRFDIKAGVLVSIALIASLIIGEIFAAGEIAFIMVLGEALENYSIAKSKSGIEKLVKLSPKTARLIANGEEKIINAEKVKVHDLIKVLPGETIPVDGIIVDGESTIDESIMTGEPIPVDKLENDEVFSGTLNQYGSFIMKATKLGKDSSLQRMIALVKSTDVDKSKIVRLADKWTTWFVALAFTLAIATFVITGEIIRLVTVLVVFCPCAFVLATPTAIVSAIGNLTKYGILIKDGDALERLSEVKKIIFDKTGTLTYGKPEVLDIITYNDYDKNELCRIVASLENKSEHPLGKAIVDFYYNFSNQSLLEVKNFQMKIGQGVIGEIKDRVILAGSRKLLKDNDLTIPEEEEKTILKYIKNGSTVIYISINNEFAGNVILSDKLRSDSKELIAQIKDKKLEPILVTGDNEKSANYIGRELAIEKVFSDSLPEVKMDIIEEYKLKNQNVAMIGDGVNDALALKKSYVGIAMGGIGSDIAIEAADIVLVGDDVGNIPQLIGLSIKTMSKIKWNIIFSLFFNFIAVVLAMTGVLNPITGAIAHNIGSVFVVTNSALLLFWKNKK
ncbi:MAG: cation-translocating P-type ATPase [Methanobrevibacter sp.]|nr:cation-translocating P-type ATPase [Methanobrevibacter sp.]